MTKDATVNWRRLRWSLTIIAVAMEIAVPRMGGQQTAIDHLRAPSPTADDGG